MNSKIEFEDLVGEEALYYGACGNTFKLGDMYLKAIEDPSDGYRSYFSHVEEVDSDSCPHDAFDEDPITVTIDRFEEPPNDWHWGERSGFCLKNAHGLPILKFGTDAGDGYYPSFFFDFDDDYKRKNSPIRDRIKR
jgi:hypothetical protein